MRAGHLTDLLRLCRQEKRVEKEKEFCLSFLSCLQCWRCCCRRARWEPRACHWSWAWCCPHRSPIQRLLRCNSHLEPQGLAEWAARQYPPRRSDQLPCRRSCKDSALRTSPGWLPSCSPPVEAKFLHQDSAYTSIFITFCTTFWVWCKQKVDSSQDRLLFREHWAWIPLLLQQTAALQQVCIWHEVSSQGERWSITL